MSRIDELIAKQRAKDEIADLRDAFSEYRVQAHLAVKFAATRAAPPVRDLPSAAGFKIGAYAERVGWIPENQSAPLESIQNAPAHAFFAQQTEANRDFLEHAEENTGIEMSPEEYGKTLQRRQTLTEMTREIARRLSDAGVETKRDDGYKLWAYSIHSETLEEIELYRRICFLPSIAAATRAKLLAAVEYFIQENRFLRFWTFTTGERAFVEEIPERLDWANERLRKLNFEIRRRWGVSILLCSWEFGTPETPGDMASGGLLQFDRDGQGRLEPTYHPHIHAIVKSHRGFLAPEVWTACCEFVREFWGRKCDFTGGKKGALIQNAREFVKYVTKPGEILKLTPPQIRKFYEATANRRLIRPLGELKAQIRARRDAAHPKTLRRKRTETGWRWIEVFDHNKTSFPNHSDEEKELRAILESEADAAEGAEFSAECEAAAVVSRRPPEVYGPCPYGFGREVPAVYDHAPSQMTPFKPFAPDVNERDFCRVVARISPAATGTRLKEPRVIVMGTRFDPKAVKRHDLVQQLWARTVEAWEAGEMLAWIKREESPARISVHTGTLTVPHPDGADGCPFDSPPVQLAFATA